MKKFVVLIHDDFEVMGNGTGNVADLQYLPALAFMNIAEKYNVKITFMVDVAHQLILKKYNSIPNIRVQHKLWDEIVLLMKDRGFDVQLHLHTQWLGATYKSGHFYLNSNWNIGCYSKELQRQLISESVQYLKALLQPTHPSHNTCAFKAGSWGLQPFSGLHEVLYEQGIRLIMGPRTGIFLPNMNIDYTSMDEKYLPYYVDPNDVTKISVKRDNMIVIPLQPYDADIFTFARHKFDRALGRFKSASSSRYYNTAEIPKQIHELSPMKDFKYFSFGLRPYRTHLNIGGQRFSFLKRSFDSVINRLRRYDLPRIPILIESHTKVHHNFYGDIERFFFYIADKYESEVEFGDLSSYLDELNNNPELAVSKQSCKDLVDCKS
jgi:hypothetical protein